MKRVEKLGCTWELDLEESGVQGHPQLCSKFEASLGYTGLFGFAGVLEVRGARTARLRKKLRWKEGLKGAWQRGQAVNVKINRAVEMWQGLGCRRLAHNPLPPYPPFSAFSSEMTTWLEAKGGSGVVGKLSKYIEDSVRQDSHCWGK